MSCIRLKVSRFRIKHLYFSTNMYTTINRHGASASLKGRSEADARRGEGEERKRRGEGEERQGKGEVKARQGEADVRVRVKMRRRIATRLSVEGRIEP